jgi:hypothetical protein
MKNILLMFILPLFFSNFIYPQKLYSPVTNTQGWVNFGVGYSQMNTIQNASALISFSYAQKGKMLSARYIYSESGTFEVFEKTKSPKYYVKEISLMYGLLKKHRFRFASFAFGLGLVNVKERNRYEEKDIKEICASLETQLFLTLPSSGIGFYGFGNLNRKWISYGLLVSFQLGKLR